MKVLSLLQPWATLVVLGAKKIETRSWKTEYRGPLLIHASKRWDNHLYNLMVEMKADEILGNAGYHLTSIINGKCKTNLPLGAIMGQVDLINTAPTIWINAYRKGNLDDHTWKEYLTDQEILLGDYSPGRYGWLLSDPVQFATPIKAKGKLSLWDFDLQQTTLPQQIVSCKK